jgi:hypothetical protein
MTACCFIEESFPAKCASAISAKEKNIRPGHISTFNYKATYINRTSGFLLLPNKLKSAILYLAAK